MRKTNSFLSRASVLLLSVSLLLTGSGMEVYSADDVEIIIKKPSPHIERAELTDTSGDFLSGYYVTITYNGQEYRSDITDSDINYQLFMKLEKPDRKDVLKNFLASPQSLKSQFGEANAEAMNRQYRIDNNIEQSHALFKERLVKRNYPRVATFLEKSYSERAKVDLKETDINLNNYAFLPEVQEYRALERDMSHCYRAVSEAKNALIKFKSIQTENAVKSISKDLINLIVSRVMMPSITPGGLSNFIPNFRDELIGLCDNVMGATTAIHKRCGVTTIDAEEAQQVIDLCWVYLDGYERYANKNIDAFMYEKGRKAELYEKAVDAAEEYRDGIKERTAESLEERLKQLSEPVKPVIPKTTDKDELLALAEDLKNGFLAIDDTYLEDKKNEDGTLFSRLQEIGIKGTRYEWPHPTNSSAAGTCFDLMTTDYNSSIDDLVFGYNLQKDEYNYQFLKDTGEDSFDKAIAQSEDCLNKLSAYETEAEERYEAYLDVMLGYLPQFEGVRQALLTYDIEYNSFPTQTELKDELESYYKRCLTSADKPFSYVPSDTDATIEDIRKAIEDYLEDLKEKKKEWTEFTETTDKAISEFYDSYQEKQEDFEQTLEDLCKSLRECKRIFEDDTYGDYLGNLYLLNSSNHDRSDYDEAERRISFIREECLRAHENYETEQINAKACYWRLDNLLAEMRDMKGSLQGLDSGKIWLLNLMNDGKLRTVVDMEKEFSEERNNEDYVIRGSNMNGLHREFEYLAGQYAYTEFSGMNSFEFSLSGLYEEGVRMKPNYMRSDKGTRDGMRDTLVNRVNKENGYYSMGHYYNSACPNLSYLYFKKSDYDGGSLQKGYYEINNLFSDKIPGGYEYDLQNGLYEPVVKLSGPVSRNADLMLSVDAADPLTAEGDAALTPDKRLEIGEEWDLGSRIRLYPENATERTIVYESSDGDICTIDDNGIVTGTGNGMAQISARALDSAWVEEEDGTVTYTPAPLKYIVLVGTGEEDEGSPEGTVHDENAGINLRNYGTEEAPRLYSEEDNDDGTKTIRMAINTASSELVYVAALYDDGGKLLQTRLLQGGSGSGWLPVSFTANPENGLRLRLFALHEKGFAPLGKVILDETIASGNAADDAALSYTVDKPDPGRSYVILSIAGDYDKAESLPGLSERKLYYIDQKLSEAGEAIKFSVRPKNTDVKQTVVLVSSVEGGESLISDPGDARIVGHINSTLSGSGAKSTPPASEPVSGSAVKKSDKIKLTCPESGARIYYTLDGSDPTAESMLYEGPISVAELLALQGLTGTVGTEIIIKAAAVSPGRGLSDVTTLRFTITDNSAFEPDEPDGTEVLGVSVDKTAAVLKPGKTISLTAKVTPDAAKNKKVIWSSSDPSVAFVSQSGKVTARTLGKARITAKTEESGFKASCLISVNTAATKLYLNRTSLVLGTGVISDPLRVTATSGDGEEALNPKVTWVSSNTNIATVSENGTVTGLSPGTAKIFAQVGDPAIKASCSVKVGRAVESITVTPKNKKASPVVEAGKTLPLAAGITPDKAVSKKVTWISGDPSVAQVNAKGVVTGIREGKAFITAVTGKTAGGTCSEAYEVTVTANQAAKPVEGLKIKGYENGWEVSGGLTVGKGLLLKAVNGEGKPVSTGDAVFYSSDETLISVSPAGKVKALASTGEKNVTITLVSLADPSVNTSVIIKARCATKKLILNTNKATIVKGKRGVLSVIATNPTDADPPEVCFSFLGREGELKLARLRKGETVDSLKASDFNISSPIINLAEGDRLAYLAVKPCKKAKIEVYPRIEYVKSYIDVSIVGSVTALEILEKNGVVRDGEDYSVSLKPGKSITIPCKVIAEYGADKTLFYESDDPSAVTVTETGKVKAMKDASGKSAHITVSTPDGSLHAVLNVNVETG